MIKFHAFKIENKEALNGIRVEWGRTQKFDILINFAVIWEKSMYCAGIHRRKNTWRGLWYENTGKYR